MTHREQPTARHTVGLFSSKTLSPLLGSILDLLYPPRCTHCGRVDARFCTVCFRNLKAVPLTRQRMALPSGVQVIVSGPHANLLQSAVQALKYNAATDLAGPLAERLFRLVGQQMQSIDMIIPVPIHTQRLRERGYNQATLIAEDFAIMTQTPCIPEALTRTRATRTQVGLTETERHQNVSGAFVANTQLVRGQRIALLDDVRTTGATLNECALALRDAGARAVVALAVTGS